MNTYIKLLIKKKIRIDLKSISSKIVYVTKILFYMALIGIISLLKDVPEISVFISRESGILFVQVLALYISFLGIRILNHFPKDPFLFILTRLNFKIKCFLYPMITSTFNYFLLYCLVILYSWFGILLFILFYTIYYFSNKYSIYLLFIFVNTALFMMFGDYYYKYLYYNSFVILLLSLIVIILLNDKNYNNLKPNRFFKDSKNIFIKKEIAAYKYYISDLKYIFIGLVTTLIYILYLKYNAVELGKPEFLFWNILFTISLIFQTTWFNLLGTETHFLNRFLYYKSEFLIYLLKRSKMYYYTSTLIFIVVSSIYLVNIDFINLAKVILIGMIFYQNLYNIALFISLNSISIKDRNYSYGQYSKVKNFTIIHLTSFMLIAISIITYKYVSIYVLLVIFLIINYLQIKYTLKKAYNFLAKKDYEIEY